MVDPVDAKKKKIGTSKFEELHLKVKLSFGIFRSAQLRYLWAPHKGKYLKKPTSYRNEIENPIKSKFPFV